MAAMNCPDCGVKIVIPPDYSRKKIRCPGCGYYAAIPESLLKDDNEPDLTPKAINEATPKTEALRVAKPVPLPKGTLRPRFDLRDKRPNFEPDEPSGVPILKGTQDEDDEKPYGVPGTGLQPCPYCRQDLPLDATFCVHCGKSLGSGEKATRVHQAMVGYWEEGISLQTRYYIFAGMQVLNFVGAMLALVEQRKELLLVSTWISLILFNVIHIALQAFIVGSFESLSVKRDNKGKATLNRVKRLAFFPLKPIKIPWKNSTNISVAGSHNPGFSTWYICAYLFLFGCLPGILFYWFVIRPARFETVIGDVYGATDEVLYRTTDRAIAEEVSEFVQEATGLIYRHM
jgi:hypothetical protein